MSLHYRIRDFLRYYKLQLPSEVWTQCWDVPVLTAALRQFDPHLDFNQVFDALDCEAFCLSSPRAFSFFDQMWNEAKLEGRIGTLVCKTWKNQRIFGTVLLA